MIGVLDAGPLYASVDADDVDHERSVAGLRHRDLDLVVPALVVAEVTHVVGRRFGSVVESRFLHFQVLELEAPTPPDLERMADLVARYGDFPLGGTDASVVALAERLDTRLTVTLDHRHFGAIRAIDVASFTLLPD